MQVYVYKHLNSGFNTCIYNNLYDSLDNYFVNKADQATSYIDKCNALLNGYILTQICLHTYGHRLYKNEISFNNRGKPYLLNHNIYFNFSHSSSHNALCVSNQQIGIDIENYSKIRVESNKLILTQLEVANCNNIADINKYLINTWVIKESFLKGLGVGLSIPMNKVCYDSKDKTAFIDNDINKKWQIFKKCTKNYVLSVASPVIDKINYKYLGNTQNSLSMNGMDVI